MDHTRAPAKFSSTQQIHWTGLYQFQLPHAPNIKASSRSQQHEACLFDHTPTDKASHKKRNGTEWMLDAIQI
eukprot:6492458-Amphidinium_carterae.1